MNDEIVLRKAKNGDENSIKTILFEISPFVLSLCRKWCRPPLEAEDIAQESLITVIKNIDKFSGNSAFKTWVYSVSYRTFLDAYRKQNRRGKIVKITSIDNSKSIDALTENLPSDEDDLRVLEALEKLEPTHSRVLFMSCVENKTYEEIASELGIPLGTVRSRLARARIKFKKLLIENGTFDEFGIVKTSEE